MKTTSITLYYREGASDKVYQTAIAEKNGGYVVNFAYGRRGSTLQGGTKTPIPVPFEKAKAVYDKLVKEKTGKGYTPGEDGTPYQQTENEQRATGLLPQLLNPITEAEAEKLLNDPAYWLQEKFDGKRVLVRKEGQTITGINRKGLIIALPQPIVAHAKTLAGDFIIDGECCGDQLYAFDCLARGELQLSHKPYSSRFEALMSLVGAGAITWVPTATKAPDKHDMFNRLKRVNKEGAVFKRHDAPYAPGRAAGGGSQLKFKFCATASCIVARANGGKRSVALAVMDGQRRVDIGNVTIPPKTRIPPTGSVIDVRYLYAFPGGSLFQPVFIDARDDIEISACTVKQLKYRAVNDEDEA